MTHPKITTCLWFDSQAEETAHYYTYIFKNSRILTGTRFGKAGQKIHQREPGSVMTVEFELDGNRFTALNEGPVFTFNEAISLQVHCDTQEEIDYYWEKLSEGGDENAKQCGWLKDRFGLSWQVVTAMMNEWLVNPGSETFERVMKVMLSMKKLEIEPLQRAFDGNG